MQEASEKELLGRLSALRTPAEAEEGAEATDKTPEGDEIESPTDDPEPAENESLEGDDVEEETEELEATDTETEEYYLDLDGEEHSLDEVKQWKKAGEKQAELDRETQTVTETRQTLEAEKAKFVELQSTLTATIAELESELSTNDINWDELREDDTAEYLRLQDVVKAKRAKIDAAKQQAQGMTKDQQLEFMNRENQLLLKQNPAWVGSDGAPTQAYQADMALMQKHLVDGQFTQAEISHLISGGHKVWKMVIDSAKAREKGKKGSALRKQAKKVPLVTRPKSKGRSSLDGQIKAAEKKFKASGRIEDAAALRKLKRQAR